MPPRCPLEPLMPASDVSVVIPAYNAAHFLADALHGIAQQTLQPREVIIVNDGSTDDTVQTVAAWIAAHPQPYPIHLHNQSNSGIAATRNQGIRLAQGEWLAFLDADDIFEPEHIAELMRALAAEPTAKGAYGAGRLLAKGVLQDMLYDDYWDSPSRKFGTPIAGTDFYRIDKQILPRMIKGNFIKPSSLVVSRALANEVGLFNEKLATAEDREFLVRLLLKACFVYAPVAITQYRWHDDNASHVRNARRNAENGLLAIKIIRDNPNIGLGLVEIAACQDAIASTLQEYFYMCSQHGVAAYAQGMRFAQRHFGWASAQASLRVKNLVRSVMALFVDPLKNPAKDYPDL